MLATALRHQAWFSVTARINPGYLSPITDEKTHHAATLNLAA